jgi:hypothetical protein
MAHLYGPFSKIPLHCPLHAYFAEGDCLPPLPDPMACLVHPLLPLSACHLCSFNPWDLSIVCLALIFMPLLPKPLIGDIGSPGLTGLTGPTGPNGPQGIQGVFLLLNTYFKQIPCMALPMPRMPAFLACPAVYVALSSNLALPDPMLALSLSAWLIACRLCLTPWPASCLLCLPHLSASCFTQAWPHCHCFASSYFLVCMPTLPATPHRNCWNRWH